MDPMDAGEYKTHFDCATAGYLNAMGLTREVGENIVLSFLRVTSSQLANSFDDGIIQYAYNIFKKNAQYNHGQ